MSTEENTKPTCGAEAAIDGGPNLVCVRNDRHINHKTADGTGFIRVGKGSIISELSR